MAQSNVPNAIAQLDDVRWRLTQALRCSVNTPHLDLPLINYVSGALELVLRIQASDAFKPPLSDQEAR